MLEEGSWLSLDRRGKTTRQPAELRHEVKENASKSPSRERSVSAEAEKEVEQKFEQEAEQEVEQEVKEARSFWVNMDSDTRRRSQQEETSRKESRASSRRESRVSAEKQSKKESKTSIERASVNKESRASAERSARISQQREPEPDYDSESRGRAGGKTGQGKGRGIKRGGAVTGKRPGSLSRPAPGPAPAYSSEEVRSAEYDRAGRRDSSAGRAEQQQNFPLVKRADSRRGSGNILSENKNRDGFSSSGREVVLASGGNTAGDRESKHFLSLQLFSQHAEPALDEFLPVAAQLELETRHREEEDALYRKFLQVRQPTGQGGARHASIGRILLPLSFQFHCNTNTIVAGLSPHCCVLRQKQG